MQTQRQNCLREPWVGMWKKHVKCNFQLSQFLSNIMWLGQSGFPIWIWSPRNPASVSDSTLWEGKSLLIGWEWTRVWAQDAGHIFAGIIITESKRTRRTEEPPRGEAKLSANLNPIRTPGRKRKKCSPCLTIWKGCFYSFNVIITRASLSTF